MKSGAFPQSALPGVVNRDALRTIAGFWAVWLALVTARAAAMGWSDQIGMLTRRVAMALVGAGLAWLIHRLLSRLNHNSLKTRSWAAFLLSIPATMIFATINTMVFYKWFPVASVADDLARWDPREVVVTAIADGLVTWYFFFAAWSAFYLVLGYVGEVRGAEREAAGSRAEAQEARLAMLRLQVDPHFLFNALNALSSLVAHGETVAARAMICNLAAFFRSCLSADPAADVTLGDEIEFQRLYLAIEHARFGDRLQVTYEIPDELGDIMVPALLLQPLVENAVKHGLAQTSASVTIAVSAVASGSAIHLSVCDYCNEPKSPSPNPAASTGIGLSNVRSRLETRYGPAASLNARPHEGGWISELILPRPQANKHD
jgi:two-component system, LytTR family, sensor kinase